MSVSNSKSFDFDGFSHLKSLPAIETLNFNFSFSNSIVLFNVPKNGIYILEAWGASGGGNNALPGAYSVSFVELTNNDVLSILVGEHGWDGYDSENNFECGGGGGGSFIALGSHPLCVSGGSGSSSSNVSPSSSYPYSCGQSTVIGGDPGTGTVNELEGGKQGGGYSGGGGGFIGNGEDTVTWGKGGISFINGGHRQESGTHSSGIGYGGFGGGGSNHGKCGRAAGGGGYTGGSASSTAMKPGGGGGSYHTGSFQNISSLSISGCESFPSNPSGNKDGFVSIALIIEPSDSLINTHILYLGLFPIFNTFLYVIEMILT